jgi:imidazolonepropionase-like amidohydrolase
VVVLRREAETGDSSEGGSVSQKQAIVGVNLIDGTGSAVLEDAVVIVSGRRIDAVAQLNDIALPPDIEVLDAKGRYLLPGLIDLHMHVNHHGFVSSPVESSHECFAGIVGANNLRTALQDGITTVRDAGGESHMNLAMRTAVKRHVAIGPRLLVVGTGICMTGGHGSQGSGTTKHEVDGPWEIRKAVRQEVKAGVDWIKILTTHRTDLPEFSQEEINCAVDEAHRLGKKVAIHAVNWVSTKMAAIAGVDTIEHGCFIDVETANTIAEKGITVVPTIWVHNYLARSLRAKLEDTRKTAALPRDQLEKLELEVTWFERCARQLPETLELLKATRVRIATGTDNVFPDQPFSPLAEEIATLSNNGLSAMEAIESATRIAAEALGMGNDLGTVEQGKIADLIMVDDNPLSKIDVLTNVSWVMQEGCVVPMHPEWLHNRPAGAPLGGLSDRGACCFD